MSGAEKVLVQAVKQALETIGRDVPKALSAGHHRVAEKLAEDAEVFEATEAKQAADAAALHSDAPALHTPGSGPSTPKVDPVEIDRYKKDLADRGLTKPATEEGPEYDYQRKHCGDTEYDISPPHLRKTLADGINRDNGMAQDAKFRFDGDKKSYYDPDSLSPFLAKQATAKMDERLLKYLAAIKDAGNPVRGLEIITNDIKVAEFIARRMKALGIPGFVHVEG